MAVKVNQRQVVNSLFILRPVEQRIILFLGDILFGSVALFCSLLIWAIDDDWLKVSVQFLQDRPPFWFYLLPLLWSLLLIAFSDNHTHEKWQKNLSSIILAVFSSTILYISLYFLSSSPNALPRLGVVAFLATAAVSSFLWRQVFIHAISTPQFLRRVVLLGYSEAGMQLLNDIYRNAGPTKPFLCEGMIQTGRLLPESLPINVALLGNTAALLDIVREKGIHEVILLSDEELDPQTLSALLAVQGMGTRIVPVEMAYEEALSRIPICSLKSTQTLWTILNHSSALPFYELQKRMLDIIVGFLGVIMLAIFFPFLSLLTWIEAGSPIPLLQERVGFGGKTFKIVKFRTMYGGNKGKEQLPFTKKNDPRVTKFGRILRKMHLDEWSQFLHVLTGEMSVVGPRPEIKALFEKNQSIIPFYSVRLSVKPGITGWAQINYDYVTDLESTVVKLEYDLYYIKHRSILMDMLIMLKTIGTMLGFKGQ